MHKAIMYFLQLLTVMELGHWFHNQIIDCKCYLNIFCIWTRLKLTNNDGIPMKKANLDILSSNCSIVQF